MIIHLYRQLFLFLWNYLGFFGAIVGISVIVSMVCLPLYAIIGKMVAKENELQGELYPLIVELKRKYADDSAAYQAALERLYNRYQYNPFLAIRKVLPLFVALPFLFLTYYMLEGTEQLNGVSFLCFKDVGKADGLLCGINLLPFVMTGINLLTAFATPGLTRKDQNQAVLIALFFLIFLYTANAALMIYWCLNQFFNMLRSLYIDNWTGAKLLWRHLISLRHLPRMLMALLKSERLALLCYIVKPKAIKGVSLGRFLVKVVCNFLSFNLLLGLVLFGFLFQSIPVEMKLDTKASGTISVLLADADARSQNERVYVKSLRPPTLNEPAGIYREYFSNEDLVTLPAFRITSTVTDVVSVRSLAESFFGIVEKRMGGEEFVSAFRTVPDGMLAVGPDGTARLKVGASGVELIPLANSNSRWNYSLAPSTKIRFLLVALEGVLVFLAIMFAMYLEPIPGVRSGVCECALVASLVALYITYAFPFQTFFANRADYPFSGLELSVCQMLPCLAIVFCMFVAIYLSKFGMGMFLPVMLLALLAYEFVQTSILSIGSPRLNGDVTYYRDSFRALRDIFVLVGLLLAACFFYHVLKKKIAFLSKIFLVVMVISLATAMLTSYHEVLAPVSAELDVAGYCSRMVVANEVKWSKKRNVLVFVLDSCTTEVAHDVFAMNRDIAEKFDGFVAFDNNVGMHHESNFATVGLMTGEYYDSPYDEHSVDAYMRKTFEVGSLLPIYHHKGANVYFLPTVYPCGYAFPRKGTGGTLKSTKSPIFVRPEGGMSFTLYELMRFRLVPFGVKANLFAFTFAAMPGHGRVDLETQLYPILKKASVGNADLTFAFFHTEGAHIPYDVDADGRSIQPPRTGYVAYLQKATYVLRSLGSLLDSLKSKDVYDSSFILVVADHGPHIKDTLKYLSTEGVLPINARPMLLAKTFDARGPFAIDALTPTSSSRIYGLLRSLQKANPTGDDVRHMLESDERLYIRPGLSTLRCLVDKNNRRIE